MRLDAGERLTEITVVSVPHMEQKGRSEIIKSFEFAAQDPDELVELFSNKTDEGDNDMMKLKGMFKKE